MTLVFVLRKPVQSENVALSDLIELSRLSSAESRDNQRLALLTGFSASDIFVTQFAKDLEIPFRSIWTQPANLAVGSDATILAVGLVLASASMTSAKVYDCNSDTWIRLRSAGTIGKVPDLMAQLTSAYGKQDASACSRTIFQLRESSTQSNSALGSFLRELLDPSARFFRAFIRLTTAIPTSQEITGERLSEVSTLRALNLHGEILELRASTKLLADSDLFFEAAREAVSFFNVGVRCLNDLAARSGTRVYEAVKVILSWASVYCISASKACAERNDIHAGLLHVFRALEFYVLAHLWQANRLRMERSHFSIGARRLFGFKEVWEEFQRCWPGTPPSKILAQLEELREQRNYSFLTHGFLAASSDQLSMGRGAVKAAIEFWESQRQDPLIEGPLSRFLQGERWRGDLGQMLAVRTLENAGYVRMPDPP